MGRGAVATPSSHLVVSAGIEHLPPDVLPRHLQKYDLLRPRPLKLGRTARPRSQTRKVVSVETAGKKTKTYNRRDSQMVTHSSTSRPVQCLCMAERTGCPVLTDLWSYVLVTVCLSYTDVLADLD
jgi:hypothetical protein